MKHIFGKIVLPVFLMAGLVLPSLSIFFHPQKAHALGDEWATTGTFFAKLKSNVDDSINTADVTRGWAREALETVAKGVAKAFLRKITLSTIDWINTGFEGNPLFIENPQTFFTDFANQERDAFIGAIAYDPYNYPFGRSFAQNLILSLQNKFERNAQFTLQSVIGQRHWSVFVNRDFRLGGWNGYLALSQPQNNPYGFALLAKEEEAFRTRGTIGLSPGEELRQQLQQSGGILTPRVCIPGQLGYEGAWDKNELEERKKTQRIMAQNPALKTRAEELQRRIEANTCDEAKKQSTTPGVAITAQLERALGSTWTQSELGAALGSDLSAIFDALINQFAQQGLTSLTKAVSGGGTTQAERNLEYYGLSVSTSETGSTGIRDWRSTPDISVNLEELLITGTPGEGTLNPVTGEYGNGPTVIELTQREIDTYRAALAVLRTFPTRLQELDACLPGVDYGWEQRLNNLINQRKTKLEQKIITGNENNAGKAAEDLASLDLQREAVSWKVKTSFFEKNIPSALQIDDEVKRTRTLSVDAKTYQDKLFTKTSTLARLKSIAYRYENIATTAEEKNKLAIEYLETRINVSTETSVREAESLKNRLDESYVTLGILKTQCEEERAVLFAGIGSDTSDLNEPFKDINLGEIVTEFPTLTPDTIINALKTGHPQGVNLTQENTIRTFSSIQLAVLHGLVFQKNLSIVQALATIPSMPEGLLLPLDTTNQDTSNMPSPFTNINLDAVVAEFSNIDGTTIVTALKKEGKTLTANQEIAIIGLDSLELAVLYALIDQKGSSAGDALANLNSIPVDLEFPASFSDEISFYCQGIDVDSTIGLFGTKADVTINCNEFYHSSVLDYSIDKDY